MAELEKLLCTDSKVESLKKINAIIEKGGGGTGLQMFDTILKDHVLTYEESKGLALQGTYVYKEAIAGSRYGYPDFYNKVIEEYNEATDIETVNGVEVKVHSNGHKFYSIVDKTAIDTFFNTMGSAWFYGVDIENERVFLPRNNYFSIEGVASSVPVIGNGMSLGLTNNTYNVGLTKVGTVDGNQYRPMLNRDAYGVAVGATVDADGTPNTSGYLAYGVTSDAEKSGIEAITSEVLKFDENKYLYICVGNTTNYEGITDVVNQGMDILEQVNQCTNSKLEVDVTNITDVGKKAILYWLTPDYDNGISVAHASGINYTCPADGVFSVQLYIGAGNLGTVSVNGVVALRANSGSSSVPTTMQGQIIVSKGDVITSTKPKDTGGSYNSAYFYPMKGAN